MDFEAIKKAAQAYGPDMTRFLRDMIAIPSESCEEKGVAHRIAEEMKKLGYDKVEFDALGNVIGWMGSGDKIIAIDSHIDTVGIGNRENWTHDPYEGYEDDKVIYGRGRRGRAVHRIPYFAPGHFEWLFDDKYKQRREQLRRKNRFSGKFPGRILRIILQYVANETGSRNSFFLPVCAVPVTSVPETGPISHGIFSCPPYCI